LLVLGVAVLCGLSIWAAAWWRSRSVQPAALMARLPSRDALIVYVDFEALRKLGALDMLAASGVSEEPEYQSFVRQTEFDYKRDLDTALVAFAPQGKYFLLEGRFDWRALRSFVTSQDGTCYNSLCRMSGSAEERRISFFPLRSEVMALAVSPNDAAALDLQVRSSAEPRNVPDAPVWISVPPSWLRTNSSLPAGTRMFARSLENTDSVTFSMAPDSGRFAARLAVNCRSEQDAAVLAAELTRLTNLVRDMIQREHQKPNAGDLSGVLTSGIFRQEGYRVFGYWPIERVFLENLFSGTT
jgi:hypothetical protein